MYEIKLKVNGKEFPVNYKLLYEIARCVPDTRQYAPLIRELLALDIPSITSELVDKEQLTVAERGSIWEKGKLDIKRLLADQAEFRKQLTDAQAEQIIALNDSEILECLALNCEELFPSADSEQAMRLSGKMADKLLEFISNHPDSRVRIKLAANSNTPAKFRPSFSRMAQDGADILRNAGSRITEADLAILPNATLEILKSVANSVEDIKDDETRQKVIDLLCEWPDPAVRLELAENSWTPRPGLERLTKDSDSDVARAAMESLRD